jgi:hypothetical protein
VPQGQGSIKGNPEILCPEQEFNRIEIQSHIIELQNSIHEKLTAAETMSPSPGTGRLLCRSLRTAWVQKKIKNKLKMGAHFCASGKFPLYEW